MASTQIDSQLPAESRNETRTTPQDVVQVLEYLNRTVPLPARTLVLGASRATTQISADGTDQYFGIPDALTGDTWAVKQGWMFLDTSTTLDTTGPGRRRTRRTTALCGGDADLPVGRYHLVHRGRGADGGSLPAAHRHRLNTLIPARGPAPCP
ncbi:hypothetical protein OHB26_23070 [Nocardia sp. NBC_01503]|uniref:hypothetical protein n=1 Tax=Nocardia sp. NBC_01503 TaxID=2975997 RepID=UPI002E7B5A57|nr:hypothetical protein [Nocardia sp. NBC_01503]WTL29839.1 hypothetical protein OHB26_23070 [Nocardia sp. NBC_01503]